MKKIIYIITLALVSVFAANARGPISPEKVQELFNAKVKFMQEKLMLSPEQTEKFIPIYKEYLDGIRAIKRPERKESVTTADEAYNVVIGKLQFKAKIITAQEKSIGELKDVLNPTQLMNFLKVEHMMQSKITNAKAKRGDGRHHGMKQCENGKKEIKEKKDK